MTGLDEHRDRSDAERCASRGCRARCLAASHCIEHVSDHELLEAVGACHEGRPLDMRDAAISSEKLQRLLSALAGDEALSHPTALDPDRARASIAGAAHFNGATFVGDANFAGVTFMRPVYFDKAEFNGEISFERAEFHDHADFDSARFRGSVDFARSIFSDHAGFQRAAFDDAALFEAAKFRSYADFEGATFADDTNMRGATFQLARQIGPFAVAGHLALDECVFGERVTIEAVAKRVSAWGAVFAGGARLSLGSADLDLSCVAFGRASTLSHATRSAFPAAREQASSWLDRADTAPRLISLCGAQVTFLSVSGIDLRRCRFFGAHGLESLVIEPSCVWLHTPSSALCIDRKVIFEEDEWRRDDERTYAAECGRRRRFAVNWTARDCGPPDSAQAAEPLKPEQLAALYRALRKASEDNNDQAGAGDLYYGEMEMRRRIPIPSGRGRVRGACERTVIGAYWFVAGYGLKAYRAITALVALILLAALSLCLWGFHSHRDFGRAVLFALQSTTSLLHPPGAQLRPPGEVVDVLVRIGGPVFLGLAILSLRSSIKR
jgi:uncharacterized protein YjbI with pentapeptide repeats